MLACADNILIIVSEEKEIRKVINNLIRYIGKKRFKVRQK